MDRKPVVITTKRRGVFFGYVENDSELPAKIELTQARMCVWWEASIKGVMGLAAQGPDAKCRISEAIPKLTAYEITAVLDCTPDAAEKWELAPWK